MKTPAVIKAALAALAILQSVMLAALFSRTMPHPPATIPLFAMGPFLGMSLSLVAAAWICGGGETRLGRVLAVMAGLAGLVSFGPHKWIDPAISEIWPAVLTGQIAAAVVMFGGFGQRRVALSADPLDADMKGEDFGASGPLPGPKQAPPVSRQRTHT